MPSANVPGYATYNAPFQAGPGYGTSGYTAPSGAPDSFQNFYDWMNENMGGFSGDFSDWDSGAFDTAMGSAIGGATYDKYGNPTGGTGMYGAAGNIGTAAGSIGTAAGNIGGIAGQFEDIAAGTDPRFADYQNAMMAQFEADAGRQRQSQADYMGRSGVTGSAALNQITGTENELGLQNQQLASELGLQQLSRQDEALATAGGLYGTQAGAYGTQAGAYGTQASVYGGIGSLNATQAGVQQAGINQNNQWAQQNVENQFGMANIQAMFPAFDIAWEGTQTGDDGDGDPPGGGNNNPYPTFSGDGMFPDIMNTDFNPMNWGW